MWSNVFNTEKQQVRRPVEWKRLRALFRPYWKEEALVLVCILGGSLLGLLPPLFTMFIIDKALPKGDMSMVCMCVAGIVGASLVSGLLGVCQGYLSSVMGEGIVRDIRCSLVSHLHHMPLEWFTNTKTGEIMNRVSNDVESIDTVLTNTLVPVVSNVFHSLSRLAIGGAVHDPGSDHDCACLAGRSPYVQGAEADPRKTR
jgi:ATP-binding cassette subfamily B protein